jgi:predicted transcriptional regulator
VSAVKVQSICRSRVMVADGDDPLADAAVRTGSLDSLRGLESAGADTERVLGTVGEAMTSHVVALADLMTAEPVVARAEWPLAKAGRAMDEAGINRLPVVDAAGRPVGILTRDDLIGALARRLRESLRYQEPARPTRRPASGPDRPGAKAPGVVVWRAR